MTSVTSAQTAAIRALLVGDYDEHRRLLAELDLNGKDATGFLNLLEASFFEIADRRFANASSMDEVVGYVAKVRSRNEAASESINPDAAERLLLHCLGQASIDDLDDGTKLDNEMMLLPILVQDQGYSEDELDSFMAEARALADEWLAKDEAEGRNT